MKLVTEEEINAHNTAVFWGGVKGAIIGTSVSLAIYGIAPRKFPRLFKLPWSIRTAVAIIPPTLATAVFAEKSSTAFDEQMYSSEYTQRVVLQEHKRWNSMSLGQKVVDSLSEHKYKIITGLWALSMYGSWVFVDRDPILTKTQKFVQARMYAQFLTVGLLLGSIGLSFYEEQNAVDHSSLAEKSNRDGWKVLLAEEEQREAEEGVDDHRIKRNKKKAKVLDPKKAEEPAAMETN
ncbi:BA75_00825T0 [Komagataella pastoris]|uniref:BA75_00825T0 n=1 Tax=Komagataella pastoris TaxID=4922 RepID=A0A1B2J5Z0_PICPA|nr:BA75_00825T0 [Komagataella pastoris]